MCSNSHYGIFSLYDFRLYEYKEEVYNVDLKVFSFIILVIAILLFERAYKKDSGKLCAFGIETLFFSNCNNGTFFIC